MSSFASAGSSSSWPDGWFTLTDDHASRLSREGYVVVDDALSEERTRALRSEIEGLRAGGLMKPNMVQFKTSRGPIQFTKPSIFEADLHDRTVGSSAPAFASLLDEGAVGMVRALNGALADKLKLGEGRSDRTVKLQCNEGSGACFPLHFDNPGRPNKRHITALFYLNPDWSPGDGGELQLVPFLRPGVVDVPPRGGRLVLFFSDRILHRTLPAWKQRFCFTVWLDGHGVNEDGDVFLKAKHVQAVQEGKVDEPPWGVMSPLQRVVSRPVYAEEYEASLRQCFDGPAGKEPLGLKVMLASHNQTLAAARKNPTLAALVARLREVREARKGGGDEAVGAVGGAGGAEAAEAAGAEASSAAATHEDAAASAEESKAVAPPAEAEGQS